MLPETTDDTDDTNNKLSYFHGQPLIELLFQPGGLAKAAKFGYSVVVPSIWKLSFLDRSAQ